MQLHKSTINAVGKALLDFDIKSDKKDLGFIFKRFKSKLELPVAAGDSTRREKAWVNWLSTDNSLPDFHLYPLSWASARLLIARVLKDFRLGPVAFSNGSEFTPTLGFNSIESKLGRSEWTCTADNFELWCETVYSHHGLKAALKKRYAEWLRRSGFSPKRTDYLLWQHFSKKRNAAYKVFRFKLSQITTIVEGNRFSTVPKNNEKDRPICVEPLANILTQRRVGLGIRECLNDKLGIDLTSLAEKHKSRIADPKVATIDLENASDRISLRLVEYLLPRRIFRLVSESRSEMTLGLDGEFYFIKKVSSMGNGFTFELMSLILTCLARSFDPTATVFGDDIIVASDVANAVIEAIQGGDLIVNVQKTHINDGYRESCGAHYFDGIGYIESFDFRFPVNEAEVLTILNKVGRLSLVHPEFLPLYGKIERLLPDALLPGPRKGAQYSEDLFTGSPLVSCCLAPFPFSKEGGLVKQKTMMRRLHKFGQLLQLDVRGATLHYGYEWKDARAVVTNLCARQWAKYLMYLASGRRCRDTVRGKGKFKSILYVTLADGSTFRWSSVVAFLI